MWEQFHNLRTQFMKEGYKKRKMVPKPCLFMQFIALVTRAVAYGDFVAR